ncbi:MAG: ANTAR domain-containing protein, partial [Actinomycetes bacterium]
LEVTKLVNRAKGIVQDDLGWPEHAAFRWIQQTAMRERTKMREVARRVIEDGLRPSDSESAGT